MHARSPVKASALVLAFAALVAALGLVLRDPERPGSAMPAPRTLLPSGQPRLPFEENVGQFDQQVRFAARASGGAVFLTATGAVFTASGSRPPGHEKSATYRMEWNGGRLPFAPVGQDLLPATTNYFLGNDPARWRTKVPAYRAVRYPDVYPGVDVVFHGNGRELEYDFIVAPKIDPGVIRVSFEGVEALHLDSDRNLVLTVAGRPLVQRRPRMFQDSPSGWQPLQGDYVLAGATEVVFRVEGRSLDRPLLIDPVLVSSTFLGGAADEGASRLRLDAVGNVYVTGATASLAFPATGGSAQPRYGGGAQDVFVVKLDPTGELVYATYLGGSGNDDGHGVALDPSGTGGVYLTGFTSSRDFPMVNPVQATNGGADAGTEDAYVARLDPSGSVLLSSTYLGGRGDDRGNAIAVDGAGSALVAGSTDSTDFPRQDAFQLNAGGGIDGFVARLGPAGNTLPVATYLGGNGDDWPSALATDGAGNVYVSGWTCSSNFPVVTPVQAALAGDCDAFVSKVGMTAAATLIYSTYLGGRLGDFGAGIAVDDTGSAYVTGRTASTNFPTRNPRQGSLAASPDGGRDVFVSKLSPAGSVLVYSTYLGGAGDDRGSDLTVNDAGSVFVTGGTTSANFPTASPWQADNAGAFDVFVAQLDPSGSTLTWATYLGGRDSEQASGIALSHGGDVWVTGSTASVDWPVAGAVQSSFQGGPADAFIAALTLAVPGADAGSEGALDAGSDAPARAYAVGCGCGSAGVSSLALWLALIGVLRAQRRKRKKEARSNLRFNP